MLLSEAQIVELGERIARRLASLEDEIACELGESSVPLRRSGAISGSLAAQRARRGDVDLSEALRGIAEWRELRAAQRRLEEGTYGRCVVCGADISFEALCDRPLTQRCTDCRGAASPRPAPC